MMIIDNKFNIRQRVFLVTDPEQQERIVVSFIVKDCGISYNLCCGSQDSWHYDFEISEEKNVLIP